MAGILTNWKTVSNSIKRFKDLEEMLNSEKTNALTKKEVLKLLMINGKKDHLAPIGNIYFMLENGPALGREARIYPDAGHWAFKYFSDWAPASFRWLKEKLNRQTPKNN